MIISNWYTNNVDNNPYNNIPLNSTSFLTNPLHYENTLIFRNKLVTTILPNSTDGLVNSYLVNYEYLINVPEVDLNILIENFDPLNTLKGVIVTKLDNLVGLGNLIDYFYQNGQLLNIIIPLHPVFLMNFDDSFLKSYYQNSDSMFTINWISVIDPPTLLNLIPNVTLQNPNAMFPFITDNYPLLPDGSNNVLGSYNMPFNFFRADKHTYFYYELIDTIPFTYVVHCFVFSLNFRDPVLHSIYITWGENDPIITEFINSYPYKSFDPDIVDNRTIVFYSGTNTEYNTNVTISVDEDTFRSAKPFFPKYDQSPYYVYYGRNMYNNYIQILTRINSFTDYTLL
ncbi:MAG: hypothetical protein ACPLX8_00075 [Nanopusillaceae archaeon]